jgi:flagellar basal body-associated protein FliL
LLKTYDPAIRHRFLFLISTATSEILKTPEGKQALAQQLTLVANQVLQGAPGTEEAAPVLGASFTTFVIQ